MECRTLKLFEMVSLSRKRSIQYIASIIFGQVMHNVQNTMEKIQKSVVVYLHCFIYLSEHCVARDHICVCCNMNDKLMLKWSKQLNNRLMATQLCVLLLCNWIAHTKTILPIVMCVWLWFVLFILMAHWVRLTNHNIQIDANSMKWSMNCFSAHKLHLHLQSDLIINIHIFIDLIDIHCEYKCIWKWFGAIERSKQSGQTPNWNDAQITKNTR